MTDRTHKTKLGKTYSVPSGGNSFTRVECSCGGFADVKVASRFGLNAWGDTCGIRETRAAFIKAKADERDWHRA